MPFQSKISMLLSLHITREGGEVWRDPGTARLTCYRVADWDSNLLLFDGITRLFYIFRQTQDQHPYTYTHRCVLAVQQWNKHQHMKQASGREESTPQDFVHKPKAVSKTITAMSEAKPVESFPPSVPLFLPPFFASFFPGLSPPLLRAHVSPTGNHTVCYWCR